MTISINQPDHLKEFADKKGLSIMGCTARQTSPFGSPHTNERR